MDQEAQAEPVLLVPMEAEAEEEAEVLAGRQISVFIPRVLLPAEQVGTVGTGARLRLLVSRATALPGALA